MSVAPPIAYYCDRLRCTQANFTYDVIAQIMSNNPEKKNLENVPLDFDPMKGRSD